MSPFSQRGRLRSEKNSVLTTGKTIGEEERKTKFSLLASKQDCSIWFDTGGFLGKKVEIILPSVGGRTQDPGSQESKISGQVSRSK